MTQLIFINWWKLANSEQLYLSFHIIQTYTYIHSKNNHAHCIASVSELFHIKFLVQEEWYPCKLVANGKTCEWENFYIKKILSDEILAKLTFNAD